MLGDGRCVGEPDHASGTVSNNCGDRLRQHERSGAATSTIPTENLSRTDARSDLINEMPRLRPASALLGLVLLPLGCSATSSGTPTRSPTPSPSRSPDRAARPGPGVVNHVCPITGRPVDPNAPTIAHKGRTIGLCSDACVARWKGLLEPIQDNFVARNARR